MKHEFTLSALLVVSLSLAACEAKEKPAPSEAPAKAAAAAPAEAAAAPKKKEAAADPKAEAEKIYTSTCVVCHGASGAGDGAGSAALDPKPRDFGDKEWQDKVTDEELAKVILSGGMAVGKSPLMPPNPGLKGKTEVMAELVKKIRSFAK